MNTDKLIADLARLKGEAKVMRELLGLALDVIHDADGETQAECEMLMGLSNDIKSALRGAA